MDLIVIKQNKQSGKYVLNPLVLTHAKIRNKNKGVIISTTIRIYKKKYLKSIARNKSLKLPYFAFLD